MTEIIISVSTIVICAIVFVIWIFWKRSMIYRNLYVKHHKNKVNIEHCVVKKIRIYSVSAHRSCRYDYRRVLLFADELIFARENISSSITNNVFHITKNHPYLSFDIKHIVCLKTKFIDRHRRYYVSSNRNYIKQEITFLYRNYIYVIDFFNNDYHLILNDFHNSKTSIMHLKRIKKKCYLRNNYRQAVSLVVHNSKK